MSDTDLELLPRYTRGQDEEAFAELVRRHLDLVFSAALRQVRAPELAEEVAQATFVKLAGRGARLRPDTVLAAWLYQITRREAMDVVRRELRRQARERTAAEMHALNAPAEWTPIEPMLDEAMQALPETDRAAILLRYFAQKSLSEVGAALGLSEDAAQKRVSRAVERLRAYFAQRGVTISAAGLGGLLAAWSVQSAPAGLATVITSAAGAAAATLAAPLAATAAQGLLLTTGQAVILCVVLAAAVLTTVYQGRQAAVQRQAAQFLEMRQSPLTNELQSVRVERDRATNLVARLLEENSRFRTNGSELTRLRGEVGSLRSRLAEREAENQKLTAESIHGNFRPRSEWADKGNGDPFAAVETMLWATSVGDAVRLAAVATPEAAAEKRWPLFPSEQPPIQTVGAVNLISYFEDGKGGRAVVTAFVREDFAAPPGGSAYTVNKLIGWQLVKQEDGWKIAKMLFFEPGRD